MLAVFGWCRGARVPVKGDVGEREPRVERVERGDWLRLRQREREPGPVSVSPEPEPADDDVLNRTPEVAALVIRGLKDQHWGCSVSSSVM